MKAAGNQDVRAYISRRQAMVDHWVALRPMFEIYGQQETGYKVGGQRRPPLVSAEDDRWSLEGHTRKDLGRITGVEATGIQKAWKKGGLDGIG